MIRNGAKGHFLPRGASRSTGHRSRDRVTAAQGAGAVPGNRYRRRKAIGGLRSAAVPPSHRRLAFDLSQVRRWRHRDCPLIDPTMGPSGRILVGTEFLPNKEPTATTRRIRGKPPASGPAGFIAGPARFKQLLVLCLPLARNTPAVSSAADPRGPRLSHRRPSIPRGPFHSTRTQFEKTGLRTWDQSRWVTHHAGCSFILA